MEIFQNNTKKCGFHSVVSGDGMHGENLKSFDYKRTQCQWSPLAQGTELSEEKVSFVTNKCDIESKPHSFLCVRPWVSYLHHPNLQLLGIYPCPDFSKTYFM